jgi:hypothetical protein
MPFERGFFQSLDKLIIITAYFKRRRQPFYLRDNDIVCHFRSLQKKVSRANLQARRML